MKKLIALLIVILTFITIPVHADGHDYDYKSHEFKEVASQFMCMCGCGQDHFECNMQGCGLNDAFKKEIKEMMDDGLSKNEIKDYYLNMYGEEILTAPEKRGFSLVAWFLPFFALGGAGTGVLLMVRKWVRGSNDTQITRINTFVQDETEDEITKSMINEERKKYF